MRNPAKKSPSSSSLKGIDPASKSGENHSVKSEEVNPGMNASAPAVATDRKRELSFELSLPALVTGRDAASQVFREKTRLLSISAEEARLWLKSRVNIGAKLDLCLDIPQNLLLGNDLKLALSGTVALAQSAENGGPRKQVVAIRLDKKYKIQATLATNS